jgi:hypothetical protein
MHFAPDLADPQVPPYYNETAFDARDMHLSSNGKQVWAARTQTTPASLYRLTSSSITTFGGHDYEIASCASDVLVLETDILVPDCDGKVQRVDANLRITAYVDQLLGYRSGPGTWTEVRLRPSAEGGAAFIVTSMPSLGATGVASSTVSRLMPQRGRKMPLEVSNASILDMALQGDAFMVILENQEGRRETLALKYE